MSTFKRVEKQNQNPVIIKLKESTHQSFKLALHNTFKEEIYLYKISLNMNTIYVFEGDDELLTIADSHIGPVVVKGHHMTISYIKKDKELMIIVPNSYIGYITEIEE